MSDQEMLMLVFLEGSDMKSTLFEGLVSNDSASSRKAWFGLASNRCSAQQDCAILHWPRLWGGSTNPNPTHACCQNWITQLDGYWYTPYCVCPPTPVHSESPIHQTDKESFVNWTTTEKSTCLAEERHHMPGAVMKIESSMLLGQVLWLQTFTGQLPNVKLKVITCSANIPN